MSVELEDFQRTVKSSQLLILAVNGFDAIETELKNELQKLNVDPHSLYKNHKVEDLRTDYVGTILISQIALLQAALEGYSIATSGGHKDMSSKCIRQHAPYYKLKVDPNSQEYHVTEIIKDIRDKRLHSLPGPYNNIQTALGPLEILQQSIIMEVYSDRREVHFLTPSETVAGYLSNRMNKKIANRTCGLLSNKVETRSMLYINLLEEEVLTSVEANDELRTKAGSYKSPVMNQARYIPIVYI